MAAQLAAEMTANGPYKFRRGAAVLVQAGCRWEEITATVGGGGQMPVIVNGQQMNVTVPVGVRKGQIFQVTGRTLDQEQGWWVPEQPQVDDMGRLKKTLMERGFEVVLELGPTTSVPMPTVADVEQ